jgi:hypothetical protein
VRKRHRLVASDEGGESGGLPVRVQSKLHHESGGLPVRVQLHTG